MILSPIWVATCVIGHAGAALQGEHGFQYKMIWPIPQTLRQLLENENQTKIVQNHMASITIVKPGWLRRTALWSVLWAVNLLARARATHGELSGIPSIHFAHWSMIDNGRRLLFLSNFDGSWENYLDDFIDKAARRPDWGLEQYHQLSPHLFSRLRRRQRRPPV